MNVLFDSDSLINTLKGEPDYIDLLASSNSKYLSVISYGEVLYGQMKLNKAKYEFDLDTFLDNFDIELLSITDREIKKYIDTRLDLEKTGSTVHVLDLFIAATAINNNLVLVTKNAKHFERIKGLKTF